MPNTGADIATDGQWLHIAVGVVSDEHGRILISERKADCAYAGQWEFPGGKVESGESVDQALARELHEELGLHVGQSRPLIRIHHIYPDRKVLLDTWRVTAWAGHAVAREGQRFDWVAPADLDAYPMLEANGPIVCAAKLPDQYLITPELQGDEAAFLSALENSLNAGVRLVRLRQPGLQTETYRRLAQRVNDICHTRDVTLMVDDARVAEDLSAGLHLTSKALSDMEKRPVPTGRWLAASCHSQEELDMAVKTGCDFAVLGAVRETASHPLAQAMGWGRFEALMEKAGLPVYALGGMQTEDLPRAWDAGGQGIAAIRGLWDL